MKTKRTIQEVLDVETGELRQADTIFNQPLQKIERLRERLSKAIEGIDMPKYVCSTCHSLVRIRGGKRRRGASKEDIFHFAHLSDKNECPIKTNSKLSKEETERIKYNGAKESQLHITLKNEIAYLLNQDKEVSNLVVEGVLKDKRNLKKWRKPDIRFTYQNKEIALELQLSTTWLSVITQRQDFYRSQGIYVMWIFHKFNLNDDDRLLTYDDVIFSNNQNAFIFDDSARRASTKANKFIFNCFYRFYINQLNKSKAIWKHRQINLDDLIFSENTLKLYHFDSDNQEAQVDLDIKKEILKLQQKKDAKIEQQRLQRQKIQQTQNEIDICHEKINDVLVEIEDFNYNIEKFKSEIDSLNKFKSKAPAEINSILKNYEWELFSNSNSVEEILKKVIEKEMIDKIHLFEKDIDLNQQVINKLIEIQKQINLLEIHVSLKLRLEKDNWFIPR